MNLGLLPETKSFSFKKFSIVIALWPNYNEIIYSLYYFT